MLIYALTIFLGAFLLFQVQPLIGKFILPWFGGGPGVWSACLLFFQTLLLAGYAYAHGTTRWLKPAKQALLHLVLLAAAVVLLPITPENAWRPQGAENPTGHILLLLLVTVGLPYFVLASTGPLLQHWFSVTRGGAAPYRLYALSNAGSLLALLSYPVLFETQLTRAAQAGFWGWGLAAYALCAALCTLGFLKASRAGAAAATAATGSYLPVSTRRRIPVLDRFLWLLLPACASALLLAVTNKLCLDVASVPFLWVAPLAIYLLSFILCFDSPRWYRLLPYTLLLIAALAGICLALFQAADWPVWKQIAVYCGGLFISCMVCHGELYRLRPEPRQLTGFYLAISAGGALGGLFVAVVAPWMFPDYFELHWALLLCGALALAACVRGSPAKSSPERNPFEHRTPGDPPGLNPAETACKQENRYWRWMACLLTLAVCGALHGLVAWVFAKNNLPGGWALALSIGLWGILAGLALLLAARGHFQTFLFWRQLSCGWLTLGLAALGVVLWLHARESGRDATYRSRNFYGVLTIHEYRKDEPLCEYRLLQHGRITHGLQFVDREQARWPVSYYGQGSGVSLAFQAFPPGGRRLGVIGLGTGTLAASAEPGDYVRIYEINPEVHHVAATHFSYLRDCKGEVEVILGDARLSMEREESQQFDLLAMDAFSSDSIPVHLLTREAFETYHRHLKTNGVIAVHISNHFLDLEPVVRSLAAHFQYGVTTIDYEETDDEWWLYSSTWMLLSRNQALLNRAEICAAAVPANTNAPAVPLWTDDFASVWQILK
ncbi:MAG TPA: fused MFS/spermidine synthase [Clostridia bacterium]|nr:fused MFS/spermidine synthase [Clostridia bacterium]